MAAHIPYVIRRDATLVFRRRVPTPVRKIYRKSFFGFSLRTHVVSEARRKAGIASRFIDDLIGLIEVCGADMLDERDMDAVVDDLMRFDLEAAEAVRETCGPRSTEAVAAAIRIHEATRDSLRAALVYNAYDAIHAPVERTLYRLGIDTDPGDDGYLRLARRCARALIEVADENIRREQGIYMQDTRIAGSAGGQHATIFATSRNLPSLPNHPDQFPARVGDAETAVSMSAPASRFARPSASARPAPSDFDEPSSRQDKACAAHHARPKDEVRSSSSAAPTPAPACEKTATTHIPDKPPAHVPVIRRAGTPDDPYAVDITMLDGNSPFSDWFAAAVTQKREDTPNWDTGSLGNWKSTKKLVIEVFGDRPISWFERHHLLEFKSLLQAIPRNHHKSSEAQGIYQIIDETDVEETRQIALAENEIEFCQLNRGDAEQRLARARVPRLAINTVYRHLQAVQFIFRLAADHAATTHAVTRKVLWTKSQKEGLRKEEKDMSRLAWGDKLPDLLNTTAFVSPAGGELHAVFWPVLIAAHAGLRMEEVLQLKADDFDTIDGIRVFRIQSGAGQHLKSPAAKRIIPIHRNLLELGLWDMVEECRARGQEWLFPNIARCAAKDRLSGTFTKVFTHYRITEGVYDPRRDFHSLRTHFNVTLKRRKCPLDIRKRLIGHELRDVTEEHYDPEGSPIEEINDWVQSIEIDISQIVSPWRNPATLPENVVALRG